MLLTIAHWLLPISLIILIIIGLIDNKLSFRDHAKLIKIFKFIGYCLLGLCILAITIIVSHSYLEII